MNRTCVSFLTFLNLFALCGGTAALAYETYSTDGSTGNCADCHGDFRDSPYFPPSGAASWPDGLHDTHRNLMLSRDCDACHQGGRSPAFLGSSDGGTGLAPYGCVGCHGRAEDGTGSGTIEFGTGLRQHHWIAGETGCIGCHSDSDPANKTAVGENVLPPYYADPGTGHPDMPTDPCSDENFAGGAAGQDNDGDGLYDGADPDCVVAVCGNGALETGETCDDGNTTSGDCCSATCQLEPAGSACSDNLFCTEADSCDGGGICVSGPARDCDDADICTDDTCDEAGDTCDNTFDPTNDPTCAALVCGNGALDAGEECDDGNTDPGDCCSATCQFEASGSVCDDGQFCNSGETCDGAGTCDGGSATDCDDGVACTVDSCDEAGDTCVQTPDDAFCDDGQFCNGAETCDPALDCTAGTAVDCDDADICTDDSCDEGADVCDNVFDPTNDPSCAVGVCGNGQVETGEECDDGNTVDGDCCSAGCTFESAGSNCEDGLFCNSGETCDGAGICTGGSATDCDDGVACTVDSCDEAGDLCVNAPDDAFCDDGLFCNGSETCDPTQDCTAGAAVDCDDADICTDDSCDEGADVCDNVFDPTNDPSCALLVCGNGQLDAGEQCDDGNTVSGDCCSAACTFEPAGSACDDGLFCNSEETCDGAGICAGGSATDCDDGIACTVDSCDEIGDNCVQTPDDAFCDDGLFCNGAETCDPALDCTAGTAVDCDDADICTDDSCNETDDACDNLFDVTNAPECLARCTDGDGDGWYVDGGDCGAVDCDDTDPSIYPGASEICDDDRDNNCDGLIDAADDACDGGEWRVRSGPLQNDAYAGSENCAECHEDRFESWQDSLHARLQIPPGDAQDAGFPLPAGAAWTDVLFVIGQKWRTEYIDRAGTVLPQRWNYLNGTMDTIPAGPYDCGACHTTGYDASATYTDPSGNPVPGITGSWTEFNIGCEACHGPGAEHAANPARDNINRITLDWTDTNEGIVSPRIRSSRVCGNCHWGAVRREVFLNPRSENHTQYSDWTVSGHASSLEFTAVNTYCAKCHSPGNAEAAATEHYFRAFEPTEATQMTCIACHDPHNVSGPFWDELEWPAGGRQDPEDLPAVIRRYQGTDHDPSTNDFLDVEDQDTNGACIDCHRQQPGFRRHIDATPAETVQLDPPFNGGQPVIVPHQEHITEGNATCLDCHMPYARRSANFPDIRSHSLEPNERVLGSGTHLNVTCGPCHATARNCTMCHNEFAVVQDGGPWANRGDGRKKRNISRDGGRPVRPRGEQD